MRASWNSSAAARHGSHEAMADAASPTAMQGSPRLLRTLLSGNVALCACGAHLSQPDGRRLFVDGCADGTGQAFGYAFAHSPDARWGLPGRPSSFESHSPAITSIPSLRRKRGSAFLLAFKCHVAES